jgi:translation initiation factor IF-2
MRRRTRFFVGWILCAVCAWTPLSAQTPVFEGPNSSTDAARKEMQELFKKVELRLREIDRLLTDASAGDRDALKANADSGMGKLLEGSQERGREVLEGIDRILELARQLGDQKPGGSGSGSGSQEEPGGQGQLDRRGQQSTDREQTPAKPEQGQGPPTPQPGDEKGSERPGGEKPGGEKPGGEKPESGANPKNNKASRDDPSNSAGPKPSPGATEGPNRNAEGRERWGELPVHVRDVFRIEGGGDMPVQYRDWIDSYYRRLNKKP